MGTERRPHSFEDVDRAEQPGAWIGVLDRVAHEPFYRHYKARVRELIAPHGEGPYLEVGAGAGADAQRLGAPVVCVDRSRTMSRASRVRGLRSVAADAGALPLAANRFAGCWADRTFQHLPDPPAALAELVRVTRPGGRIVTVDPDYGTQSMEFPEPALAQKVFDYRADCLLRNGRLAHRMETLFAKAGLVALCSESLTLTVRDPTAVDNVMGLRSWARSAMQEGLMDTDEIERWESLYDRLVAESGFFWSVEFFLTVGQKPV